MLSKTKAKAEIVFRRRYYFIAGTEQYWLAHLDEKRIDICHRDGRIVSVTGDDPYTCEGIAEGLVLKLGEIYPDD